MFAQSWTPFCSIVYIRMIYCVVLRRGAQEQSVSGKAFKGQPLISSSVTLVCLRLRRGAQEQSVPGDTWSTEASTEVKRLVQTDRWSCKVFLFRHVFLFLFTFVYLILTSVWIVLFIYSFLLLLFRVNPNVRLCLSVSPLNHVSHLPLY